MNKKIALFCLVVFILSSSYGLYAQEEKLEKLDIKVMEVKPFAYCCIHKKGPYDLISQTIGEVWMAMQKQQIQPTGIPIGIYYNDPSQVKPEDLEWEFGTPFSSVPKVKPPLEAKEWNFTKVVSAIHQGRYEDIGKTIGKMITWIFKNGHVPAGPLLERYLTEPGSVSDPKDNKSEIWIPIK